MTSYPLFPRELATPITLGEANGTRRIPPVECLYVKRCLWRETKEMCTWRCDAYIVMISCCHPKDWTRIRRLEQSKSHSLQARKATGSIPRMMSGVTYSCGGLEMHHYRRFETLLPFSHQPFPSVYGRKSVGTKDHSSRPGDSRV
jgi:hypothetical protein